MNQHSSLRPELREIADGEIIETDGIYSMSIEWYHQQCTSGPSISSTGIRQILRSPAEYWKTSALNPNRVEEGDKKAFVLGRAAHHLILGEAEFAKSFVVRPEEAPDGRVWNGNNLSCKAWIAAEQAKGRTVLSPEQIEQIRGMAGLMPWQRSMTNCGLANTPLVMAGALSGEIERSLIWKMGKTWVKSRPDVVATSSNDFIDLKTTSRDVDFYSLQREVRDRQYYVQGALVGMAVTQVLRRQMTGFHLVFVHTSEVHAVGTYTLDAADLVLGERCIFVALSIFERCMETGIWPGPTARQTDAQNLTIGQQERDRVEHYLDELEADFAA